MNNGNTADNPYRSRPFAARALDPLSGPYVSTRYMTVDPYVNGYSQLSLVYPARTSQSVSFGMKHTNILRFPHAKKHDPIIGTIQCTLVLDDQANQKIPTGIPQLPIIAA